MQCRNEFPRQIKVGHDGLLELVQKTVTCIRIIILMDDMMLQIRGVVVGVGLKQGPRALATPRLSSPNMILTSVTQQQHQQHV